MTRQAGPGLSRPAGDVLFAEVDEATRRLARALGPGGAAAAGRSAAGDRARSSRCWRRRSGRWSSPAAGVFWSEAEAAFQALRRGGGHARSTPRRRAAARSPRTIRSPILSARSLAFREADLILVLGTRMNYVIGHALPPRFNADARIVRVDIDAGEIAASPRPLDLGIVADARSFLEQATAAMRGRVDAGRVRGLARAAARAQRRQGGRAGGGARLRRGADPSAAALPRASRLPAAGRDPLRRRAGDPELRPPDHPDLPAAAPAELGRLRHHGRRDADRARRQGRLPGPAGGGAARRRLVRDERDGVRHRGAPPAADARRHQPERRLDRRPQARATRAANSATPASTCIAEALGGHGALRRDARTTSGRRSNARWRRSRPGRRRWSTS